jgi:hypothetical protein
MTSDDGDADQYELGLRQADARRTLFLGAALLIVGVAVGIAWFIVTHMIAAVAEDPRTRIGILGLALFLVVLGVSFMVQAFRKRAGARALARSLEARRQP